MCNGALLNDTYGDPYPAPPPKLLRMIVCLFTDEGRQRWSIGKIAVELLLLAAETVVVLFFNLSFMPRYNILVTY